MKLVSPSEFPGSRKSAERRCRCGRARREHANSLSACREDTLPPSIVPSHKGLWVSAWCPTACTTQDQIACEESIKHLVENVLRYAKRDDAP